MRREGIPVNSLDEIFLDGAIVYVDTSAHSLHGHNPFSIFGQAGKNTFSEINPRNVLKSCSTLNEFCRFLNYDSALVIPEVVLELNRFKKAFNGNYMGLFSDNPNGHLEIKGLLKTFKELIVEAIEMAKDVSVSEVSDMRYVKLTEMVNTLSIKLNLKKQPKKVIEILQRDYINGKDTDEKMVAMAYYSSLYERTSVNVLSGDKDFESLFRETSRFLGSSHFLPYNQLFRDALSNFPIKLFYIHKYGIDLVYQSSEIRFREDFINKSTNSWIRGKISSSWRDIHELEKVDSQEYEDCNQVINARKF